MKKLFLTFLFALPAFILTAGEHPSLLLTKKGVAAMREAHG